jgi:hypothetical protein
VRFMAYWIMILLMVQSPKAAAISEDDARLLIENTPEFRQANAAYRAPAAISGGSDKAVFYFQARSSRTLGAASGLLGNYTVDKRTGQVLRGLPPKQEVDTFLIRDLRQQILNRPTLGNVQPEVVDIRDKTLMNRLAKGTVTYSAYGIKLGERFPANTPGLRQGPIQRPVPTGPALTGYAFSALNGPNVAPSVEAYLGTDGRITEMLVEILPGEAKASFDWFFGKEFMAAVSTQNVDDWGKVLGTEPIVSRGDHAMFIDAPSRGFAACVSGSPNSLLIPSFMVFYLPGNSPREEKLADSVLRRKTYCVGVQND